MAAAQIQLFPEPESDGSGDERASRLGPVPTRLTPESPQLYTEPTHAEQAALAALEALESVDRSDPAALPVLSDAERQSAGLLSLGGYYMRHLSAYQQARVDLGRKSGGIADSSRQTLEHHLNAFARWDRANVPPGWPAGIAWDGTPLSRLAGKLAYRFEDFLVSAVESGNEGTRGGRAWSLKTAVNTCGDLRWVLARAVDQGVIDRDPIPRQMEQRLLGADGDEPDAPPVIYSDAELGRLYAVLPKICAASDEIKVRGARSTKGLREVICRELQAAIVLSANAGPRMADLLQLEFGKHVLLSEDEAAPSKLVYVQRKKRKTHVIRLAAVTVRHLTTLRQSRPQSLPGMEDCAPEWVFPHLIQPDLTVPVKSEAKRRATALLKEATAAIGLPVADYDRPWHVLRHSCTTRFNDHAAGIGKLITHGPDADVASQSYDNPLNRIATAVETIGWPAEFLQKEQTG